MLVEGFVVHFRKLLFHPLASFLVSLPQGQVSVLDLIDLVSLSPLGGLLLLVKITDVVEGFLQRLGRFGRSCRNVARRVLGKRSADLRRPRRVLFGLVRLHRGINVLCFHRRTSSKSPVDSGYRFGRRSRAPIYRWWKRNRLLTSRGATSTQARTRLAIRNVTNVSPQLKLFTTTAQKV